SGNGGELGGPPTRTSYSPGCTGGARRRDGGPNHASPSQQPQRTDRGGGQHLGRLDQQLGYRRAQVPHPTPQHGIAGRGDVPAVIEQTFSVSGPAELDISFPSGSLAIESGLPGRVAIYLDTKDPEAWRVEQSGDTIIVAFERGFPSRGGRARIRVVTPERSALRAKSASGDIAARVELGKVTVNTASGEVELGDVASAAIKTASGDVVL